MEVDYLCLTPTSSKSAAKVNILREQGERKKVKKHKIPTPALPKGGSFTPAPPEERGRNYGRLGIIVLVDERTIGIRW